MKNIVFLTYINRSGSTYLAKLLDEYEDIKIVIYVIPGRTGTAISSVDIAVLSYEYDRVIAIKEATGDISRMIEERDLMPDISIMSGDDDKTVEMVTSNRIKASGVISVVTNIVPGAVTEMVEALLSGNSDKGKVLAESDGLGAGAMFSLILPTTQQ